MRGMLPGWADQDRREADKRDLLARLRWTYPTRDPIDHMKSPGWIEDLTAWAWIGHNKKRR